MKHQIKYNPWDCMLTASAMILNLSSIELATLVGHDGSEIIDEKAPEPGGRRGHHPQEIIDVALAHGWAITQFDLTPMAQYENVKFHHPERRERFIELVNERRGVLCAEHHAVAFCHGVILDPDGPKYNFSFEACAARSFYPVMAFIYDNTVIN